jgi:hypothetical protein
VQPYKEGGVFLLTGRYPYKRQAFLQVALLFVQALSETVHYIRYSVLILKMGTLLYKWRTSFLVDRILYSCNVRALASTFSLLVLILSCIRDIDFYYHCLFIICYSIPENYMQFLKNEFFL